MSSHLKLLTQGCLATLLLALPAIAQNPDADSSLSFGEIVDVRVINLEVVVTDGKDRVNGLTSDDFRIRVDGQEIPVEYFTEVQGGQAVTSATLDDAAAPALAPGDPVGTRYLVFIDESFALRPHRNRVLRNLSTQLSSLSPEDSMAVVAFDGNQLALLSSWTSSHRELERVFEQAKERPAYGLQRRIGSHAFDFRSTGYRNLGGFGDPYGDRFNGFHRYGPRFGFGARPGSQTYAETDRVLDAAASAMRGFAKPSGRKVMMLLSGGWPTRSGSGFSSTVTYRDGHSERFLLRPLVDTANRLGYTLYPVDVKGVENHYGGAQYSASQSARLFANIHHEREWFEETTLHYLADETGGRAMIDGASLTALERTAEDTRSYYWLGITPTWQENDQRHRVKIDVLRKGLKVRFRQSFSDLSRQTEVSMLLESAQLFDLPIPGENQQLGISFGEPEAGGFRKVLVPLKLEIPLDQVTLLPYQGGYAAQLELRVAATDDRGNNAAIPVIPVELRGQSADSAQVGIFEVSLKLRRRPHRLLVSLHDPTSGNLISKRFDLQL